MEKHFKKENIHLIDCTRIVVPEGRQRSVVKNTDEMALSI